MGARISSPWWWRALAWVCGVCPVCQAARRRSEGRAARFVRAVENRCCPFCMAYERVHGRPAHLTPRDPTAPAR